MSQTVFRPLVAGEEHLFRSLPGLETNRHAGEAPGRPEHSWIALCDDRVVARAGWVCPDDQELPVGLVWFDFENDQAETASALLTEAHRHLRDRFDRIPEYHLFLTPGWRDRPAEAVAVTSRLAAARLAALHPAGERIRTVWTAVNPLPEPPGLFEVRPVDLSLLADFDNPDILTGVETAFAAGVHLADEPLHGLGGPQAFAAFDIVGAPVGLAITGLHHWSQTIGYLAVKDDSAVSDLLIGVTAALEAQGVVEICADTDTGRAVVLDALALVGYRQTRSRLVMKPR